MATTKVVIVHGGELARDVAEQVAELQPSGSSFDVTIQCASERPKALIEYAKSESKTVLCFVMQTIENESATEEGSKIVRFLKRKTHPDDLLTSSTLSFAVLGVGDSNLLLDRQTTGADDCNQAAKQLDKRLEALGGTRLCDLGVADERTGLTQVDPWIKDVFWKSLS